MGKNSKPKSARKGRTTRQDAPASSNAAGPSGTVWNSDEKTADTLFPNANTESTQTLDEDQQMQKAIEESKQMYEESLQKTKNLCIKDDEDMGNESDDKYWTEKQRNLPDPEPEKAFKPPDTNNNSSSKSERDTQINDHRSGRSVRGRRNGNVEKKVHQLEEAAGGNNRAGSVSRGKRFECQAMGRGSGLRESQPRMDQQKSQAVNSSVLGDYTESETHDSRRNERSSQNNRESSFRNRQSRGYSQNAGRDSLWRDQYHYVRDQAQFQRQSEERPSSNNHETREIHKTISTSYESSNAGEPNRDASDRTSHGKDTPELQILKNRKNPDVSQSSPKQPAEQLRLQGFHSRSKAGEPNRDASDKNSYREETPKLQILKNERNPDVSQSSPKQPTEQLRLQGFHSRSNRPPPDDEDSAPSTSKPEITTAAIATDGFTEKLETQRSSGMAYNSRPGSSHPQTLYNRNEAPINTLASNPASQHVYEKLAVHDPLLHRLLIQKQMYDQPCAENREAIVGYEDYEQEQDQVTMVQPLLIPEHQTYIHPQGLPPGYVIMYYPNQEPQAVAENSLSSNIDYVDTRPNVQMASESGNRVVTPRGTAPSHRTPVPMLSAQRQMFLQSQFQAQYFENAYENLVVPECSLATNQYQADARFSVAPGRQQYTTLPANSQFVPVSQGLRPGFPQAYLPPFVKHHSRGPPITQYDEATNIGYQPFDHSHGNTEMPRNIPPPVSRDTRQLQRRPQPMPNMERARERLPQMR